MGTLDGVAAFITGGGSGIGRGVVERFVAEGARVGVLERSSDKIDDLKKQFGSASVAAFEGDAVSVDDTRRAVAGTIDAFGAIDTLVANVGVWDFNVPLSELPEDELSRAFDELYSVNVKSYLIACRLCLPTLVDRQGSIILTVSNAGFYPNGGGALYTSSKFAVRGLVTQLAFELAPRVRVNGVAPGGTVTELGGLRSLGTEAQRVDQIPGVADVMEKINPLGVVATAEDHSWAYAYLASRRSARTVTGVIINTDGGIGVRGIGLST